MTERMSVTGTGELLSPVNDSVTAVLSDSSCGDAVGLRFQIQIGLAREQITLHPTDQLTLPALRELCCAFVDRKVWLY